MTALASRYLNVAKNIATAAGVTYDLVHLEHEQPYQAIIETAQYQGCDVIQMASPEGLFGGLAARFHGVPTEYSQRKTLMEDAPKILSRVREDRADAAVHVPFVLFAIRPSAWWLVTSKRTGFLM